MSVLLTKKEAVEFLGIDEKIFNNFFKNANEFECQPRANGRGRFYFDKNDLIKWKDDYQWRTISLNERDYARCLDFALAQHFRGYVLSDWGSSRQREFGQKVTNWVKGQLAEVAVQKFLEREFGLKVELDFSLHESIVPQDITGVYEKGELRDSRIGVGIKASKPKSSFLILAENEVDLDGRRSDVYIFCRPDIPDDHLLRITSKRIMEVVGGEQHFNKYAQQMPDFEDIDCEIAGWIDHSELEKVEAKTIPGLDAATGFRYIKKSGDLNRDEASWAELASRL